MRFISCWYRPNMVIQKSLQNLCEIDIFGTAASSWRQMKHWCSSALAGPKYPPRTLKNHVFEGEAHFHHCIHSFGLTKIVLRVKFHLLFLLCDYWKLLKTHSDFHQNLIMRWSEQWILITTGPQMGSAGRFKNTSKTNTKSTYSSKRNQSKHVSSVQLGDLLWDLLTMALRKH